MENDRNIEQNNPVNCDLNNMMDKDVQLMLWPLNLLQFFSFTPGYRISNNYITPNSFISNIFSMIGAIVFISLYIFRTYMLFVYKEHLGLTKFMTVTSFTDCIYYCFGFALNFVIGIIQTKHNIKFVLIFQRVHRFLNDGTSFKHLIIWNWIMVIVALSFYFIVLTYLTHSCLYLGFIYLLLIFWLFSILMSYLYAIRFIKLLQNKLNLWNIQVLNSLTIEETRGDDFCKRMSQAYADILECYDVYKAYFQPFILYYIIEVFLHSLIYIQMTIEGCKIGFKNNSVHVATLSMFSLFCWLGKNLTWQTMFMQRCDTFYLAVQRVRDTCAVILKSNCSDEERKLCKNVLRLHRASFSKMRVCGLFYADVASQLSLMGLLANYTIVLLQFAFL